MGESLDKTTALITGATSGIGRATAVVLAREGAALSLLARRESRLKSIGHELREEYDIDVHVTATDVRNPDAVTAAVENSLDRHGQLDIVINNAGTGIVGDLEDIKPDAFQAIIETNVNGTFYVTQSVLPALQATNGNLVFIGSFAGQFPFPANPVYAGTKGWIRSFAHSLEASLGTNGISVTVINPGGVRTSFEVDENTTQSDRYGVGEAPEPEEIADAVLFACKRSDAATVHELDIYRRDQLSNPG